MKIPYSSNDSNKFYPVVTVTSLFADQTHIQVKHLVT